MGGEGGEGWAASAELRFEAFGHPVQAVDDPVFGEVDEAPRHMERLCDVADRSALDDTEVEDLVMPGIGFGPDLVEGQFPQV